MKRREFIAALGGAAAWPLLARGEQSVPLVGFLNTQSPKGFAHYAAAFRQGLQETGFVEGTNVTIEYRWGEGDYGRLPALVAQLLERGPAVIAATGGTPAAAAAKAATKSVPVVFEVGIDPVETGLVASLNRPGGNLTGVVHQLKGLGPKLLELLREIVPGVGSVAVFINPRFATNRVWATDLQQAAQAIGQQLQIVNASNEAEIAEAFTTIRKSGSDALIVAEEPFFANQREQIVALASRYSLPAVYSARSFSEVGGLASYATDIENSFREAGHYTGRSPQGGSAR